MGATGTTSDKAVLINVSSMMAHARPVVTNFAYSMAKAANLKMIEYFAAENPNIHVVSLQPGIINTELGGDDMPVFVAPDTSESFHYELSSLILLQLLSIEFFFPIPDYNC